MRRPLSLPCLVAMVALACGDKDADTAPTGVGGDDSGATDDCADQPDGTVIDADEEAACGGTLHACDPTGERVRSQTTCQGGVSIIEDVAEDCEVETGCVMHEGDLTVRTDEDVAALAGVQAVRGNLILDLDDSAGLEDIAWVEGSVAMGARDLSALGGMSGLRAAEGGLSLLCVRGDDLSGLSGLEALGDLTIVGAGSLTALSLPALSRLDGELQLDQASDQACGGATRTLLSLTAIGPFAAGLTRVGSVDIQSTRTLETLGGLAQVVEVGGDVTFLDNTLLSECEIEDWLEAATIGGETDLRNNADCQ
jgi:hypothetical protein